MANNLRAYLSNRKMDLPKPLPEAELAAQIRRRHRDRKGATFNRYFGEMLGQPLYAVSLYSEPETALVISGRDIPVELLERFLRSNSELLSDPRLCVGTWYQEENDLTFIDVVAVLPEKSEAVALGEQYNQIAIFSLAEEVEIDTSGTGEWTAQETPPNRRLPELKRK